MTVARRSRVAALLALCAALVTVPASAAPAPVTLAGTTVINGSRTASVAVRLPRAVDFDVSDIATVSPRGRITGIVLKKDGAWNAPYVSAIHVGFCAERGCEATFPKGAFGFIWAPGSTNGLSGRLPAGNYRLHVVVDGAPTTVTITFRGLKGKVRITPTGPARAAVVAPKPTVAEPASSPALFAGGSAHTTGSRGGIHHMSVWKELPAMAPRSAVGQCIYSDGKVPTGGPVPPYQMPCADGVGGFPFISSEPGPAGPATTAIGPGRFISGINAGYLLPPGRSAIGGYHNTPGPVTAAYVHQLWLDF